MRDNKTNRNNGLKIHLMKKLALEKIHRQKNIKGRYHFTLIRLIFSI